MEKDFGLVQDVCADLGTGKITSIIVPGNNKFMNIFSQNNDIEIPWQNIKCIGDDLILVEIQLKYGLNIAHFFYIINKGKKFLKKISKKC